MKKIVLSLIACVVILWSLPCRSDWGNNVGIQGMKWTSIATATTTVIKSTACFLHTITVTGGTAGYISVYASGTSVGNNPAFYWPSTNAPQSYLLDSNFASGCTVVTGNATNITVTYL